MRPDLWRMRFFFINFLDFIIPHMSSQRSAPSLSAIGIAALLIIAAVTVALVVKNTAILFGAVLVIAVAGTGALYAFFPRRPSKTIVHNNPAEIAILHRNTQDTRNEIIGAMAILQQELRILQDARYASPETKGLREDIARVSSEIAALKAARANAPAAKDEVPPLSFDDVDEKPLVRTPVAPAAATPPAGLPRSEKPSPIFVPEAAPVVAKGLEPEAMDDEGDWLTGGLEEEDLIVSKKVDFDAIVKKDAERPKPKVDEEEQRVLREEMAQMADEDDWVGGGLEDRDVKVKTKTDDANEALMEKLRAEVEAKRATAEAAAVVRAPARGETALIVNVTLPHGNKLFIRGVGPGLDPEKGAAMQQSAHGKWQWICPEKGKPCVVTVWENDETQAEGNPIRIPGGFALTVTPTFRRKLKLT